MREFIGGLLGVALVLAIVFFVFLTPSDLVMGILHLEKQFCRWGGTCFQNSPERMRALRECLGELPNPYDTKDLNVREARHRDLDVCAWRKD